MKDINVIIQEALTSINQCIYSININDSNVIDYFLILEGIIHETKKTKKLYNKLSELLNTGVSPGSPESLLAAYWLSKISDDLAFEILIKTLLNGTFYAQFASSWALRSLQKNEKHLDELLNYYKKNKNKDVASELLSSIIIMSEGELSDWVLKEIQTTEDKRLVSSACRSLSNLIDKENYIISILLEIAKSKNSITKITSGYFLLLMNDISGLDIFQKVLEFDNDLNDLKWGLTYAKRLSIHDCYPQIKKLLNHPNDEIAERAIEAIGPYGLSENIEILIALISEKNESINDAIIGALNWVFNFGEMKIFEELYKNIGDKGWFERRIKRIPIKLKNHSRYWYQELLNPKLVFNNMASVNFNEAEISMAQLRFSYGFRFKYETDIPWIFNLKSINSLSPQIKEKKDKFIDGDFYQFGEKIS